MNRTHICTAIVTLGCAFAQIGFAIGDQSDKAAHIEGRVLGQKAHNLAAFSDASVPHVKASVSPTSEYFSEVIEQTNLSLDGCSLGFRHLSVEATAGEFTVELFAKTPQGQEYGAWNWRLNMSVRIPVVARLLLNSVSGAFQGCVVREVPRAARLDGVESLEHVDKLVPKLNARLTGCTLRRVGNPGASDATGNFSFYMDAVYPDGHSDPRVHFETSAKNDLDQDVEDFLTLIPSQAFLGCSHVQAPPPPVVPPVVPPGPDHNLPALQRHVQSVLFFANKKLKNCRLQVEGDFLAPLSDGTTEFFINALYADGTTDTKRRFRTALTTGVEDEVKDLLEVVPSQLFRKCEAIGGDGSGDEGSIDRVEAAQHAVGVLAILNDKLDGCIVTLSGNVGQVDEQGNFSYFLMAYVKSTGRFTDPARFQSNYFSDVAGEAGTLLRIIPTVEFHACAHRAP